VLGGQLGKTIEIIVGYKRTSGVVGTDQNDGGGVGEIQAGKVDVPMSVEAQPIGLRAQTLQAGQVLEKWIARLRAKHALARIAQQLKQQRVRFA